MRYAKKIISIIPENSKLDLLVTFSKGPITSEYILDQYILITKKYWILS